MRYKLLGRSGLRVSQIALGTMTFGEGAKWSRSEAESREVFDAYVEAGGNFIDTANMYTGGESERIIGKFVKGDRERFVIASKYANAAPGANDPNAAGSHRKSLVQSINASLKRLDVDYLDLYYVHWWDFTTPIEEVQRALDDAITAGKILHLGLSDVPAWIVSRAQAIADIRGVAPVAAMQLEYSLVQRSIEREHIPLARAHDIAVTAWSPLAGGILTGKYTREQPGDKSPKRLDSMALQPLDDRNRKIAETVDIIALERRVSAAEIALAWVLAKGGIPIAGATTKNQMETNLKAVQLQLDQPTLNKLDEASEFDLGHPYQMAGWEMAQQLGYAGMLDKIDIPGYPISV